MQSVALLSRAQLGCGLRTWPATQSEAGRLAMTVSNASPLLRFRLLFLSSGLHVNASATKTARCRLSLEVISSLRSLRSLHAMRAMHAMQPGRVACNDATTSPIVTGLSSVVVGQSSFVRDCSLHATMQRPI